MKNYRLKQSNLNIVRKLGNDKGETISETLIALLIASLALVMLAGAISAASHMVTNSRNRLNGYYKKNEADNGIVYMDESKGTSGTVTITGLGSSVGGDNTISVNLYKNDEFKVPVIAYRIAP